MKLDILAIGVHPDDVELCCAGTVVNEIRNGKKVGVVDLTRGELGSRGTADTRLVEALHSAKILGLAVRENLMMRDGFFKNDETHQLQIIQVLRKYRPDIVLSNILEDRHPDHGRAGQLIHEACFLSGLVKIETFNEDGTPQEKWRPRYVFQYMQDSYHEPDFIIDISDSIETKIEAIKAFKTQFFVNDYTSEEPQTYISTPDFFESIIARSRMMGKRIGVKYGEAFLSVKKPGFSNFNGFILQET